ncbi:DUF2254 domain-containing protein [Fodinibacter luteus]|uniref:DUF2254 domain-containing protein n=2 Tax=Fodinibacter luteus TaxID=552064 RepID=A0ABP8JY73_9MICO
MWWERTFWPLPLAGMVVAFLLQDLTVTIDESLADLEGSIISPAAALTLLAAVGGGMVTFTGFVFSVILLMLQYGSATYSPRSVSYFLRLRRTQLVLAAFLGTITFSFLALVEVGSGGRDAFAPVASVAVCVSLLLVSLIGFLALIQGVGSTLKVDGLLSAWGRMAQRQLSRQAMANHGDAAPPEPDADGPADGRAAHGEPPDLDAGRGALVIRHPGRTGQVVAIDGAHLGRLARRAGSEVVLLVRLGDGVGPGTAVARVHGPPVPPRHVARCVLVAPERSLVHDPLYAVRLLTDVSLRALSPAVNDPTTAVRSLHEIEDVLRTAAARELGTVRIAAGAGSVTLPGATWDDVVDLCLLEVVEVSTGQPQVVRRLTALLRDLLDDVPEHRRAPLRRYLTRLEAAVHDAGHDPDVWLRRDRQGVGGGR